MPIVRRVAGTIGKYQGCLPASAGAPRTLGVVCRVRWHVTHVNDTEVTNIDPKLHCRRAEERANLSSTELFFALDTILSPKLTRMVRTPKSLHLGEITLI